MSAVLRVLVAAGNGRLIDLICVRSDHQFLFPDIGVARSDAKAAEDLVVDWAVSRRVLQHLQYARDDRSTSRATLQAHRRGLEAMV
jgi:hypothetical protein